MTSSFALPHCKRYLILLIPVFILVSCSRHHTLFERLGSSYTGIHFDNAIRDSDSLNILNYEYIYNGGGVAVADFNGDGKPDLYFTGNMVPNRLYLNEGHMHFKDVTKEAHAEGEGKWCSGVSVVDINNDGRPDLYICVTESKDPNKRRNILYINQGLDKNGVPVFKDEAHAYGLDDTSYSSQAAFFDYDNDGDLDMYLVVDQPNEVRYTAQAVPKVTDGSSPTTDKLYENVGSDSLGHPFFKDVSRKAGINIEGFGLGVNITDINHDGWKDILVTNDFLSNDLLWINNHDGTFTNESGKYFKHTSYSAMGNDVEDINNDGLQDVMALDMMPYTNYRKKTMMTADNYYAYINNAFYGYEYEYPHNTLQLNMGMHRGAEDSVKHPVFSEIAFMAGVAMTDWSWTPLVADFDNDGFKDMVITNGFPKDITDMDFATFRSQVSGIAPVGVLLNRIPSVKLSNFAYRNDGNLRFSDVTRSWGLTDKSFSNGAVWADLEGDGALDLVVNNINGPAFIYRNTLYDSKDSLKRHHWLEVTFKGQKLNLEGQGAWVDIYYDHGKHQTYENTVYRGYLSSVQNMAHFGTGSVSLLDSVVIRWPDGAVQCLRHVLTDRVIQADHAKARPPNLHDPDRFMLPDLRADLKAAAPEMTDVTQRLGIHYVHSEQDFVDFNIQQLLPHKLSEYGPSLTVGDVDGNGLEDVFIGGSKGHKGVFLLQQPNGSFLQKDLLPGPDGPAKIQEDEGALLFDADGDGHPDLYITSGSDEDAPNSEAYQDRFYLNDGKGHFRLDTAAIPRSLVSKSCVVAADFDHDGDLDLFVGGRVDPGSYPRPVSSRILRNDSRPGHPKFTDITGQVAPELRHIGMVTDAIWTDIDGDGWPDLVLSGEWMPITILKNNQGKSFTDITASSGLAGYTGLWTSLVAGDFNNDGKIDFIAGNEGLNTPLQADARHPIGIYAKDFDQNGTYDAVPTVFWPDSGGVLREFPVDSRDRMIKQLYGMRRQFPTYKSYASATIHDLFTPEQLKGALQYHATELRSCYLENLGHDKFKVIPLPMKAQVAPLFGMVAEDVDEDGNLDLVCTGNDYGNRVLVGRLDALYGLVLKGDGSGHFHAQSLLKSGIYIPGDGKSLVRLLGKAHQSLLAASQNQGPLKVFALNRNRPAYQAQPQDAYVMFHFKDGRVQRQDLDYGSSFQSASGRFVSLPAGLSRMEVYEWNGSHKPVPLPARP